MAPLSRAFSTNVGHNTLFRAIGPLCKDEERLVVLEVTPILVESMQVTTMFQPTLGMRT